MPVSPGLALGGQNIEQTIPIQTGVYMHMVKYLNEELSTWPPIGPIRHFITPSVSIRPLQEGGLLGRTEALKPSRLGRGCQVCAWLCSLLVTSPSGLCVPHFLVCRIKTTVPMS